MLPFPLRPPPGQMRGAHNGSYSQGYPSNKDGPSPKRKSLCSTANQAHQLNKQLKTHPFQGSGGQKPSISRVGREAGAEGEAGGRNPGNRGPAWRGWPGGGAAQAPEQSSPPGGGPGGLPCRWEGPSAPGLQQEQDVEEARLTTSPWRARTSRAPAFQRHSCSPSMGPIVGANSPAPGLGFVPWTWAPLSASPASGSLPMSWAQVLGPGFPLVPMGGGTETWTKCPGCLLRGSEPGVPGAAHPSRFPLAVPPPAQGTDGHFPLGAESGPPAALPHKVLLAHSHARPPHVVYGCARDLFYKA